MSKCEEILVDRLVKRIVSRIGRGLDKQDCYIVCWIAYLENRSMYLGKLSFWEDITLCIIFEVDKLRKERNRRFRMQSKLSLDQKIDSSDIEVREILRPKKMGFEDGIALWDYAKRLGKEKERIMRLMAQGENDQYIMNKMNISKTKYERLREELKKDMIRYLNL